MADIREEFTNLREFQAGEADKYFLANLRDNSIVTISDLPKAIELPCNYLADDQTTEGYYPPVKQINPTNASLFSRKFTIGKFAYNETSNIDGIVYTENKPTIDQRYIYRPTFRHSMAPSDLTPSTITLGGDTEAIVDDFGPVDGLTIEMQGGASIYFPDWDNVFKPDDYLSNCDSLGGTNNHDLPCKKHIETCKNRAEQAKAAEIARIEHCVYHMDNSEEHDHAASNTPPSCDDFDPLNAYDDCYFTCAYSVDEANRSWLSSCKDGCGQLRPDITSLCGCGGDDCKSDLSCGWELLLNE
ncbi:MAG: hypothetical protein EBY39_04225 [Flavobacteriia bacterium]|nr:hypothetical protein [Flavobacteriia bacterium]